jgi:hypothetical protein
MTLHDFAAHGATVLPVTPDGQEDPEDQLDGAKRLPRRLADSDEIGSIVDHLQDEQREENEHDAESKGMHHAFSSLLKLVDDSLLALGRHDHLSLGSLFEATVSEMFDNGSKYHKNLSSCQGKAILTFATSLDALGPMPWESTWFLLVADTRT